MVQPYTNHADAVSSTNTSITNKTDPDSISQADVSSGIQRTNAMVDAIVVREPSGVETYYSIDPRTTGSAGRWFKLLHDIIDDGVVTQVPDGSIVTLPPMTFQPTAADPITIDVTVQDLTVMCNGAAINSSAATVGEIITPASASLNMLLHAVRYDGDNDVRSLTWDGAAWTGDIPAHTHPESDIIGMVHDATRIQDVLVDDAAIADGRVLEYNATSGNLEYVTVAGSGDMLKSEYDLADNGIVDNAEKVEGVDAAGNSQYYGTNAGGTAGFYTLPAGGSATLTLDVTKADGSIISYEPTLPGDPVGDAEAWFALLKTHLEGLSTNDTISIPPVRFKPATADAAPITVPDSNGISVMCNGAEILQGDSTVGEIITSGGSSFNTQLNQCRYDGNAEARDLIWNDVAWIEAGMTLAVYDVNGNGIVDNAEKVEGVTTTGSYKYYGTDGGSFAGFHDLPGASVGINPPNTVEVTGTSDAATDMAAMQGAIDFLKNTGGRILAYGNFIINDRLYFSDWNNGSSQGGPPISLIGNGPENTQFDLISGAFPSGFSWFGNSKVAQTMNDWIDDPNTKTGVPATPGVKFHTDFNVVGHGLVVNDWVMIWSIDHDDILPVKHTSPNEHSPGELVRVASVVDADNFTTEQPVIDSMTTCQIQKHYSVNDFVVKNFSILPKHDGETFRIYGAKRFTVSNIEYIQDPADIVNTGMRDGPIFRGCAKFLVKDCKFSAGSAAGQLNGASIMLEFMNTSGTIKNIKSQTTHHHFDTGALQATGLDDGASGTYTSRIGTQRDIFIDDWTADHQFRGLGNRGALASHDSGWGMTFAHCVVNCSEGASAFEARNRFTRFIDCRAISDGTAGTIGFTLRGNDHQVIGGTVENFQKGIDVSDSGTNPSINNICDGVHVKDCETGAYLASNDSTIENCTFTQNGTIAKGSANALTHMQIVAGMTGHKIRNNSMTRGTNLSAIHAETYVAGRYGTIAECYGNQFRLHGNQNGFSEAFYGGAVAGNPLFPDTVFAADWQDDNELNLGSDYASQMIDGVVQTPIVSTVSYHQADWTASGIVTFRTLDIHPYLLAKRSGTGGTSSDWLQAELDAGQWSTKIDGTSKPFLNLPGPEVGPVYDFAMTHDATANTITLTVNGVTSDPLASIIPLDSRGDFMIGSDKSPTVGLFHEGDLGVVFDSSGVVFSWPTTSGTLSTRVLTVIRADGTTTDYSPVGNTPDAWFALLKSQLETAEDGNVVLLPPVLFHPNDTGTATNNQIDITTDISIYGPGAVIKRGVETPNSSSVGYLIRISGNASFHGITFDGNGDALDPGDALDGESIRSDGNTRLSDCSFVDSLKGGFGFHVRHWPVTSDKRLTMTSCYITDPGYAGVTIKSGIYELLECIFVMTRDRWTSGVNPQQRMFHVSKNAGGPALHGGSMTGGTIRTTVPVGLGGVRFQTSGISASDRGGNHHFRDVTFDAYDYPDGVDSVSKAEFCDSVTFDGCNHIVRNPATGRALYYRFTNCKLVAFRNCRWGSNVYPLGNDANYDTEMLILEDSEFGADIPDPASFIPDKAERCKHIDIKNCTFNNLSIGGMLIRNDASGPASYATEATVRIDNILMRTIGTTYVLGHVPRVGFFAGDRIASEGVGAFYLSNNSDFRLMASSNSLDSNTIVFGRQILDLGTATGLGEVGSGAFHPYPDKTATLFEFIVGVRGQRILNDYFGVDDLVALGDSGVAEWIHNGTAWVPLVNVAP